jgi:hypothetical protein
VQLANSHEVPVRMILGVDAERRVRQALSAEQLKSLDVASQIELEFPQRALRERNGSRN